MSAIFKPSIDSNGDYNNLLLLYAAAFLYNQVRSKTKLNPVEPDSDSSKAANTVNSVANPVITEAGFELGRALASAAQSQLGTYSIPARTEHRFASADPISDSVILAGNSAASNSAKLTCDAARLALPTPPKATQGTSSSFFSGFASAAQGAASDALGAAGSVFGWAASQLSYSQIAICGLGFLATAYLTYNCWKGSGVNVINSANNTNTVKNDVHFHIDAKPGMEVVKEKLADGSFKVSVKAPSDDEIKLAMMELIEEIRKQREESSSGASADDEIKLAIMELIQEMRDQRAESSSGASSDDEIKLAIMELIQEMRDQRAESSSLG